MYTTKNLPLFFPPFVGFPLPYASFESFFMHKEAKINLDFFLLSYVKYSILFALIYLAFFHLIYLGNLSIQYIENFPFPFYFCLVFSCIVLLLFIYPLLC